MDHVNHLQRGKRHPLLLSPFHTFLLFAVLFGGNVLLLIVLVRGAAQNEGALESIARSAELERAREAEQKAREVPAPVRTIPDARTSGLRISMPEGWKWRGCQASESGDSVEIMIGR